MENLNREIKFRVWTGEEMITPPQVTIGVGSAAELIQIDLKGSLSLRNAYGLDGFGKNPTFDDPVKYVLMQYTGLTAVNDKLIYEGDIIYIEEYGEKRRGIICYTETECRFYIKWITKTEFNDILWIRYFMCSVIGNIYETPELLNP